MSRRGTLVAVLGSAIDAEAGSNGLRVQRQSGPTREGSAHSPRTGRSSYRPAAVPSLATVLGYDCGMPNYLVPVPGGFAPSVAYLDLETTKVPTDGFVMPNGEALRRRWRVTIAGIGLNGWILIGEYADEAEMLSWAGLVLREARDVCYSATREFDEMICRGRFTNARRAHLPRPTFPAVPGAEALNWQNVRTPHFSERGPDVPSREISRAMADGRYRAVLVHNLRDVAELVMWGDGTSPEAVMWCRRVLTDYPYAEGLLFGQVAP